MNKNISYDGVDANICKKCTFQQSKYFQKCINLAQRSNLTQQHGCVLVQNNQIISCGYNYKTTNKRTTYETKCDCDVFSIHAEVSTLKKVKNRNLRNCEMYIVRIGPSITQPMDKHNNNNNNNNMVLKYSLPCKMCTSYIHTYGIRKVYYSVNTLRLDSSSSVVV
jgi:tRNA(Arg) A34 adenosine deaminase TadA